MTARERLTKLIELATQDSPQDRHDLARELCDLLLDWPANYPHHMREPFEALLEKTLRAIDRQSREMLVRRIAEHPTAPLELLNELYFCAAEELRGAILLRNAHANRESAHETEPADLEAASLGARLVETARGGSSADFTAAFSVLFELGAAMAERILGDDSGQSLAVACKGAHLGRAAYSALALLTNDTGAAETRLSAFDSVPQAGAECMLAFWKTRHLSHAQAA